MSIAFDGFRAWVYDNLNGALSYNYFDQFIYQGSDGIPYSVYGLIGITTGVLAFATLLDVNNETENSSLLITPTPESPSPSPSPTTPTLDFFSSNNSTSQEKQSVYGGKKKHVKTRKTKQNKPKQ